MRSGEPPQPPIRTNQRRRIHSVNSTTDDTLDARIIVHTMIGDLLSTTDPALASTGLEILALYLLLSGGYDEQELRERFRTLGQKDRRFRFEAFWTTLLAKMHRASGSPVPAHLLVRERVTCVQPPARDTKRCTRCGKEKARSLFYADSKVKDGLSSWCVTCHREAARERKQQRRGG